MEQHKGSQDDFVATASSMPFSIEPDQSTDRDQAALVTNQSGTEAQTDWSTDDYVTEAGQEEQHKWFQEAVLSTASSSSFSIEPDQ